MILWDGKSESVFLELLERVEKKQPVRVETADGAVRTISTLEDVRGLLPPARIACASAFWHSSVTFS